MDYVPFEKPILDLERRIAELTEMQQIRPEEGGHLKEVIGDLEQQVEALRDEIYNALTPMQKCQLARHPLRPYSLDYIGRMCENFVALHGDRQFSEDSAIVGGFAALDGRTVMVIGHQKGRGTKASLARNFGMPRPEGYRKALRLMKLAARFDCPIVTLIDTPGAYPGIGAEERGQAEAIAHNLVEMSQLPVPVITAVIGEGGSGGALALGVANRILMMQHAVFAVISPEGCAAILWKDAGQAERAAEALRLTSRDLFGFGICDMIVEEARGGAHRDVDRTAIALKDAINDALRAYDGWSSEAIIDERMKKFRKIGQFIESEAREK